MAGLSLPFVAGYETMTPLMRTGLPREWTRLLAQPKPRLVMVWTDEALGLGNPSCVQCPKRRRVQVDA